jgi:hypothetical protein
MLAYLPRRLEIAFAGVQVAAVFISSALEGQGVPGEFHKRNRPGTPATKPAPASSGTCRT